jgi:uncharacterized Zn finger protein
MSNHQNQSLSKLEKAKANKKDGAIVNMRFVKGLELAAGGNVRKIVPSTTSATLYKVQSEKNPETEYSVVVEKSGSIFCDCPDFSRRNITCKHIYAVISKEVDITIQKIATWGNDKVEYDEK